MTTEIKTHILPMVALKGLTIFPGMVIHFDIGREKSKKALEEAMVKDQKFFVATQKDENIDLPTTEDVYDIGTLVKIKQMLKLPGDAIRVLVEGIERGRLLAVEKEEPYLLCQIQFDIEEEVGDRGLTEETLMRKLLADFDEFVSMNSKIPDELFMTIAGYKKDAVLADIITSHLEIGTEEKQKVLDNLDPISRMMQVHELLLKEIEIRKIDAKINMKVRSQMDKNQREYHLREQLHAIEKELGMDEKSADEADEWRKEMKEKEIPEEICQKIEKEIHRLSKMAPSSAEGAVIRTYIETILELPWNKVSDEEISIPKAEKILNKDHYGLEKVKERILEYLAVMELSRELKGPILCLAGPPGTGKTSIAGSIARATGREFVRMSLGGVRDEAEIRGHRRTYIGAIPGRVINSMKDAGTKNPVFLLDEVDKLGADFKGDPSSALLEVLDPEQNKDFSDHYLEVPFDLSKVMFITTANTTSTIPGPLLDRMEIIEVTGYTEAEKLEIAKRYLIPKKMKEHGLSKEQFSITSKAVRDLINYYTRESGVRNLEREIANLCRKIARKIVAEEVDSFKVKPEHLEGLLGKKIFRYDKIKEKPQIGITTGMAWTRVGGDTLFIEASIMPGNGKFILTGQLGDVMQESAKTGISYVRSTASKYKIQEDFYKEKDIHIHIPEGAVPKDGPSAGVTMCVAIISALTGTPVRKDVSMTGEITLRGNVLPVGGIKEKVLAAHRAGIKKVLLPFENEKDIEEIPEKVRKDLEIVLIKTVDDALKEALVKN